MPALLHASRKARAPACSKATCDESTSWYEPSTSVDLDVDQRVARRDARERGLSDADLDRRDVLLGDRAADDLVLEGDVVGELEFEFLRLVRRAGLDVDDVQSPNWPRPPVCFELPADASAGARDRLAVADTRGLPTWTPIFMSRMSLFLMISRCSSPMPAMMVWPVSSLKCVRNDGSSRRIVTSASASFFLSSAVLRLDRHRDHRLGEVIRSSTIGFVGVAERVARDRVLEADDRHDRCPPADLSSASRSLACISKMRRRVLLLVVDRVEDAASLVQRARVDADVGQVAVRIGTTLNTRAENGSSSWGGQLLVGRPWGPRPDRRGPRRVRAGSR
jgi:hypothetical protein